jgi:dienelactone hydrolase
MSLIAELKRRNVFRVGAAYIVSAWLLIQVAETIFPLFGFDDTPARVIVIVLVIGFIPALIFSWAYELTAEGLKKERDVDRSQSITHHTGRKLDFIIIGMLIAALGYFAYDKFVLDPRRDALTTVNTVAGLAEVRDLVGEDRFTEAYIRAQELEPVITDESLRQELWEAVSVATPLDSVPRGADIWMRPYDSTERDWEHLGQTPLENARLPFGMSRLRLELKGYRTLNVAWWDWDEAPTYRFDPVDSIPEGMVRVQGDEFEVFLPGLEHLTIELPDYLIDATEVTNRQYKRFVDAGGYSNPEYWEHHFALDSREQSFEEAMELFKDRTGRPGPSTWEVGMYSDDAADHPVGGVSWYEAAAYARFVGKQIPTLFHWYWAAYPHASQFMLPHSNFGGAGSAPVGTHDGISPSGSFDMAGNVREWTWNQSNDERFILGGGWKDPEYMFTDANAQSPFDRSEINGFRLMVTLDDTNLALAREPIVRPSRDYFAERPVSDDIFDVYRRLYSYDMTALNDELVAREEVERWSREEIELDAAYGDERFTIFLYLPVDADPPYPTIVYFPGSNVIYRRDNPEAEDFPFPFLITSGHAVLFPVYKGTFERGTGLASDIQNETNLYREHVIQWSKDLGRSIDYLETRSDIAMGQLGYFGLSWGSAMAPVMLAMEPRIKASVLISGGLVLQPTQPEVDPFNFLPRVGVPTHMVNVPNDYFYPLETSQKPFYEFLGADPKDRILLDGGHLPPMNDVTRETLDWFDQYLMPQP